MAQIDITKIFDQRHKWDEKDEYTLVCKVCGKKIELTTFHRNAIITNIESLRSIPKVMKRKIDLLADVPFMKVNNVQRT